MSDASRAPPPARAAAAVALAMALAAAGAAHHGQWAGAQGQPAIELLHAGAAVPPPLVELHASPEPAGLELVASGVGGGAEVSLRVVRSSHWGAEGAPPLAAPTLADHGGGEATLTLGRSSPGELVVEAAASGASGAARSLYVVRVLDALPAPGGHDGAAPSRIVGNVDPADPALPRILAQAGKPLCADTPHARDSVSTLAHWRIRESWMTDPTMAGVPPIEGMAMQDAEVLDPDEDSTGSHSWWWGCRTRASFGTQLSQWIYVCDVPGSDRTRYYARQADTTSQPAALRVINPYTGKFNVLDYQQPAPQAAAPGPHWFVGADKQTPQSYPPPGFDPHAPIQPNAHVPYTELFFNAWGSVHIMQTRVKGTFSSVPEFLPLDSKVVLRATAFHSDDVVFYVAQPPGSLLAFPSLYATVNGTLVPTRPVPEPHHHHPNGRDQYFQNGTQAPHYAIEHGLDAVAEDLKHARTPAESHYHRPPNITAKVRVSDIALQNGILVEGITDGIANLPKGSRQEFLQARGAAGDSDIKEMEVKRLHDVMLVAEIPVDVTNKDGYAEINPAFSIAPWECWPRLNQSAACLMGRTQCPSHTDGTAWRP